MFFLIPVGVDYKAKRLPWVTFSLMGVNLVVYLVSLLLAVWGGSEAEIGLVRLLGLRPSNVELHSLITSLFTHTEILHLLGNMIYLFLFGACVEDILGRWRFLLFYLLCGLAADFVHIIVSLASGAADLPMVGASGAISGCLGAFILLLGKASINFRWFFWLGIRVWSGDFWLPAWPVISFWFLKDLFSVILGVVSQFGDGGIAFGAHVGGFVCGLGVIGIRKLCDRGSKRVWSIGCGGVLTKRGAQAETFGCGSDVYLCDSGVQTGPVTMDRARMLVESGALSREAYYWRPGMADWRPVTELFGR